MKKWLTFMERVKNVIAQFFSLFPKKDVIEDWKIVNVMEPI